MATFNNIALQEPSTVTARVATVSIARGSTTEQQEILERVQAMAQQYQMPIQKLIKQLEERGGFGEIHEQIIVGKVLDFLQLQASVEEVPASAPAA